ncbi:MAG: glycosyltransferase family 61 protein [Planctomycetia bacterium]|nr:glycosyltransferase family 61 protein [Planctomycetia bacterium]
MSRITGIWKRRLRPGFVTAAGRWFGAGVPAPRAATTIAPLAAAGRCARVSLERSARRVLPPHEVSGDLAAVAGVRARIDNPLARERYDRLVVGAVPQPATDRLVAVLPDGHVAHDAGIVMTAAGELVDDVSGYGFDGDDPTNPLRIGTLPRPRPAPHTLAVLTTGPHRNYFHWLMDALPRLDLYERAGLAGDHIYAPVRQRFQRESLALAGIDPARIVPATRRTHLASGRLVVSTLHGCISPAKTDFLHRRFTARLAPWSGPGGRIFVSRAGRGPRAVVNERELVAALAPLGFRRCRLERMSLAEQLTVFHRAECVIGPHGAGLTNLVFCRPGTQVVEIGTPYRPWSCFYEIAHHRGLDYHLHMASPERVRHFDPGTAVGDSDLRVDARAFRDLVGGLLEGRGRRRTRAA